MIESSGAEVILADGRTGGLRSLCSGVSPEAGLPAREEREAAF